MSMQLCYMSGYGIEIDDLRDLLNDTILGELEDNEDDIVSTFEKLIDTDDYISYFISDDGQFLYIRDSAPYAPVFTGIDHINEYFYNKLKPYLKKDATKELLAEKLNDVFSYDYC